MPWHKDSLGQVLITIQDDSRYSSIIDPRNVLARVLSRIEDLNLQFKVAFELEFYLFKKEKIFLKNQNQQYQMKLINRVKELKFMECEN